MKQSLPQLPVPTVEETIAKYLHSVKPFLNDAELKATNDACTNFLDRNGTVSHLQKRLLEKARNCGNWLEDWWLKVAYLGFRNPVVVYSSPGQTMPLQHFGNEDERLRYTAKLIEAAASYITLIRR